MRKKLIISETQFNRVIKPLIVENEYSVILDELVKDLDKNYEKVTAMVKDYHDYKNEPKFKVIADDSIISAKDLLEYFKVKYHNRCNEKFIKQVIDDWYFGKIKDGMLSKNVALK